MLRSMALAGVVGTLVVPLAAPGATTAPQGGAVAAAPAGAPPRVSPYVLAARRQAQVAPGAGHAPALPPAMQRTRRATSQAPTSSPPRR
jgi:hypothetical protein